MTAFLQKRRSPLRPSLVHDQEIDRQMKQKQIYIYDK